MNGLRLLKRGGLDILKGSLVATATLVGLAVAGVVTNALGLPPVGMPAFMNLSTLVPLLFVSEVLIAIVLGECFQRLYQSFWHRLLWLWMGHYVLYYALNNLDAFLFTTYTNLGTSFVANLFPALFAAASMALLWRPAAGSLAQRPSLSAYLAARRPGNWAWRFAAAWLCFPLIYYLAGRGAAAFTLSYYQNPGLDLGLALKFTLGSLMAMEVLRGALFLLAVLPIIVAWRGSQRNLWLVLGLVIFIQIAIQTLVQAYWMPFLEVRIPHSLEMLADSYGQAAVAAWLLAPRTAAALQASPQTVPAM